MYLSDKELAKDFYRMEARIGGFKCEADMGPTPISIDICSECERKYLTKAPELYDVLTKLVDEIANNFAMKFDEIVFTRLDSILGKDNYDRHNLESLKGRLEIYEYSHPKSKQVFCLDGEPFVEFLPMQVKVDGGKIRTEQQWRYVSQKNNIRK